ncbi:MAG TPA: rRNA maturation RNase YbeY [Acidimicrobiia bacterium]|nr:rRNA maturation RNase YbeY [Acidimicrobiia bacterium]
MNISFSDEQDRQIDSAGLVALATRVLRHEDYPDRAELTITAVTDDVIASLKAEHLGIDEPTDVLSFPIDQLVAARPPVVASDGPPLLMGDVVIAPAYIARQAAEHGVSESDELALMVVHGVLHLMGWDHVVDREAEAMEEREREILAMVGVERR